VIKIVGPIGQRRMMYVVNVEFYTAKERKLFLGKKVEGVFIDHSINFMVYPEWFIYSGRRFNYENIKHLF